MPLLLFLKEDHTLLGAKPHGYDGVFKDQRRTSLIFSVLGGSLHTSILSIPPYPYHVVKDRLYFRFPRKYEI